MTARRMTTYTVIVGLLLSAGFFTLVLRPLHDEDATLGAELAQTQAAAMQARADLDVGRRAQGQLAGNERRLLRAGRAVPEDLDQPSLVYELDAAAREAHLSFVSVALKQGQDTTTAPVEGGVPPGAVAGASGEVLQPLQIEIEGTYAQISRFLGRIRRFVRVDEREVRATGRLIAVDAVSLGASDDGFPSLTATISATTYLRPTTDPPTPSTDTAATPTPTPGTTNASSKDVSDR